MSEINSTHISKEQLEALVNNSVLNERAAKDLDKKFVNEKKKYEEKYGKPLRHMNSEDLKKLHDEFPIISMSRKYTVLCDILNSYAMSKQEPSEGGFHFICPTDQLSIDWMKFEILMREMHSSVCIQNPVLYLDDKKIYEIKT